MNIYSTLTFHVPNRRSWTKAQSLVLLFWEIPVKHMIQEEMHDANLPKKRRNALKTAILTKKIKNFHKSKIDGLQKFSTRAPRFYDFLHFKG